mmetsp:Transcript_40451/g.34170  ORF Transcript_40451/g.34170 Transcript_40451/m.34170 type:complete len:89 (+) Transcript_40451:34-300(+)
MNFIAGQNRELFRRMREQTGMKLEYNRTAMKFMFMLENDAEVMAQVNAKTDLVFSTLDSFIVFRLTGNLYTSLTMASSTCLVDLSQNP